MPPVLAIVVPCYNEQEVLAMTVARLTSLLASLEERGLVAKGSFVMCSDDGSTDSTWQIVRQLHGENPAVKGVSLTANRGHQYALLAGLEAVIGRCDVAVTIDADLQDDPDAIPRMLELHAQGAEIVYGVRSSRCSDTWFKRSTAHAYYRFQQTMGLDTVFDHADYRLMSQRALQMLALYGESNLFLRGIVPQLGLATAIVEYERAPRAAGRSKHPLGKMLSFAIDGITSFSARPMRIIFMIGLGLLLVDAGVALYVFVSKFGRQAITGWASLMMSIWFLGSLMLMGLGIVGEYIGKIYLEVKKRPRFHIGETLFD